MFSKDISIVSVQNSAFPVLIIPFVGKTERESKVIDLSERNQDEE